MTVLQQYTCPLCDYAADNPRSVASHIQASTDEVHAGEKGSDHWEDIEKAAVEGASSSQSTPESGDGGGAEPARFPTAEGASETASEGASSTPESTPDAPLGCCPDPTLSGDAGDVFELENGTYIQLEQGDQICLNCEEIHE